MGNSGDSTVAPNSGSYLKVREPLWNLPLSNLDDRWDLFNSLLDQYLRTKSFSAQRKCRFLELGVWTAGTLHRVMQQFGAVIRYTGVDPYGQLKDDPYKGQFWSTDAESEAVYQSAKTLFNQNGAELRRETSERFFALNREQFDVIFVDGDHRMNEALRDMENALRCLNPGGLLIIDDYGNSFHPEVEWAVREFLNKHRNKIGRIGNHPLFFQLEGQYAPVMLSFFCAEKLP